MTISPTTKSSVFISKILLFLLTAATSGNNSIRDAIADEVLEVAFASKNFPSPTITGIIAPDSM